MATWWEKTVEYLFVVKLYERDKFDFAAPMSGSHERSSGDAVFGKNNKLVLIEFKRDIKEVNSEASIFIDYEAAKKELSHHSHHWLVWGKLSKQDELILCGRKYFKGDGKGDISDFQSNGISHSEFDDYLEILNSYKHPDKRGSGGHVSPSRMNAVLGISADGKIVGSTTLADYAPHLFPAATPDPSSTPSSSSGLTSNSFVRKPPSSPSP